MFKKKCSTATVCSPRRTACGQFPGWNEKPVIRLDGRPWSRHWGWKGGVILTSRFLSFSKTTFLQVHSSLLQNQPYWVWLDFTSQPGADFKMFISSFPSCYIDESSPAVNPIRGRINKSCRDEARSLSSPQVALFSIFERKNVLILDATSKGERKKEKKIQQVSSRSL